MSNMLGPYPLNSIITGDARILAKAIPDESVDLICADPPYAKEYLPLYGWLAETAKRILKPGASCIAFSGSAHLPEVINAMNYHLRWFTCLCLLHEGQNQRIWPLKLRHGWKPIVWFTKGQPIIPRYFISTVLRGSKDKTFHSWGQDSQSITPLINDLVSQKAIVFDPFTGGGTVPAVCKMLGHRYLAFEISEPVAEMARERVRNTQPPLFTMPQPEQAMMFQEEA